MAHDGHAELRLTGKAQNTGKNLFQRAIPDSDTEDEVPEPRRRLRGATGDDTEGTPVDGLEHETTCADRWKNLSAEETKRMWGIYDETGIFVACCRHGSVQLYCDMIRSGEL